jgi:peptide/nickel transport system substrate-binding protein
MVRAWLLCVPLLLLGCRAEAPDALVFAVATAPRVLDPRLAADAASERVNDLLFASLVELSETGEAEPGIAAWKRIDPRTYHLQ